MQYVHEHRALSPRYHRSSKACGEVDHGNGEPCAGQYPFTASEIGGGECSRQGRGTGNQVVQRKAEMKLFEVNMDKISHSHAAENLRNKT